MSLDIDWRGVADWEKLLELYPDLAKKVAFATMWVHLGSVTAENLEEWEFRILVLEYLGGYDDMLPTTETLNNYLGLKANVPDKTRREFMADVVRIFTERLCSKVGYYPDEPFKPGQAQLLLDKLVRESQDFGNPVDHSEWIHDELVEFGYDFEAS